MEPKLGEAISLAEKLDASLEAQQDEQHAPVRAAVLIAHADRVVRRSASAAVLVAFHT